MESRLLGSLGKVAGLGGIALGVFLLLFRGVLQTQFLPQAGLNSAQAFAVILALMILTFGIAAIGVVAWLVSRSANPKTPIPALALGVLARLIMLVLGAAVYVGAQARADIPSPPQSPKDGENDRSTLFVKCQPSPYPTSFPNDGTIHSIIIWKSNERGGITRLFAPENAEFTMLEGRKWLETYQCEVVNYGDVPLFNVTMALSVKYLQAVKRSHNSQISGELIDTNERVLSIDRIDFGPEHAYHFFIFNLTIQFIHAIKIGNSSTCE